MRILELTLPVADVPAVAAYFRDVLQLPVEDDRVRIGWSTLHLTAAHGAQAGGVHLAFNVPDNRFAAAQAWLRARAPLQQDGDGRTYFALESSWQSQSLYFTGPEELVLELIGRRRLPASSREGGFHGSELTCLSEVGLPSTDVPATQAAVEACFGLQPLSAPSPQFAPMGDDEGLLILVDAARRWFPEGRVLPAAAGVRVRLGTVATGAVLDAPAQGWHVTSR